MNTDQLVAQHELGARVLGAVADGLTHAESLRAPEGGGNCANWVVGHLVKARNDEIAKLGLEPVFPLDRFRRYAQGQAPLVKPEEAIAFDELMANFATLQDPLIAALRGATSEVLDTPVPGSPTGNPNETVGSLAVATAFHEAYHLGQIGLIRRTLGKAGFF